MQITAEQQKELARFPRTLRSLVEAELAAGNSIVEVGHSFPAPPAGAYFKLATKISTRPRASGNGLSFYERNTSIYSGEFTDSKRFYFVLEPPNPPPPEPDMNAIREAANRTDEKDQELIRLAERSKPIPEATSLVEDFKRLHDQLMTATSGPDIHREAKVPSPAQSRRGPQLPAGSVLQSSTATDAAWLLHFQDTRPPQEIQFQLERDLMILMPPRVEAGKLTYRGQVRITGARYSVLLTHEAIVPQTNCYSLNVDASWAELPPSSHDYFRKTSANWFELWTRHFQCATPPSPTEGLPEHYARSTQAALHAEDHLDSVPAIQQAILAAMKRGAAFATSHKEGGTNIRWQNDHFLRIDYGESEQCQEFGSESEFLKFLRQFYHWETSRNIYLGKASDFDAWKLILRLLRTD